MERRNGIACALCATALVSACFSYSTTSDRTPRPVLVPVPASEGEIALARLIEFAERVRREPPAQQRAAYVAAKEEHAHAPDAVTRLRLATLLVMAGAPFRDEEAARALLRAASRDDDARPPLRTIAALWLRELEQRLALERALEEERRRRQGLEHKVEQLKTIEEEMNRRQTAPVVPAR